MELGNQQKLFLPCSVLAFAHPMTGGHWQRPPAGREMLDMKGPLTTRGIPVGAGFAERAGRAGRPLPLVQQVATCQGGLT